MKSRSILFLAAAAWFWGVISPLQAELTVATWNLKWFPSGRAEHRASARVEDANCTDAAEVVRAGLAAHPGDGVVLFFQELRDAAACSNLVAKMNRPDLKVACVSAFREFDRRLGWQQCGIVTSLPVLDANFSYWRRKHGVTAPRGYAYALLDAGKHGLVACFNVHLKSNYGATTAEKRESNAAKRELCTEQLVELARKLKSPDGRGVTHVLIGGDFNADPFSGQFREKTFALLTDAGFENCWEGAPLAERGTHVGTGRYPDSTLDFIYHRGFASRLSRALSPAVPLTDHRMVWLRLE